ncbi:hypothetical protein [Pontibacter beigongshangensis]|uniref:hypothetical protein n=1 Tax=Pontibacter beigongshangensis TaxID=2574733 RepID=UPI00164EDCE3|nr:hypothetical protein [Pontibacter beigongshangensis]
MKQLLFLLLATFAFACGNSDGNRTDTNREATTTDENVEIGSGNEINPQLELESDTSSALEVDTVTSAGAIDQRRD